jgi:ubiquinone/menaquinone biosynthesis C-methylase UbiE
MPASNTSPGSARRVSPAIKARDILTAASMTIGRGAAARAVAKEAGITADDKVIDIGCGPGTAVRQAARRGATATGVDPAPVMLRLARWISAFRQVGDVTWLDGRAEALPLPDGQATIAWALSSVHHWDDRVAGLSEARRVLGPAGRVVLAERLAKPAARGHAAHGLSHGQAEDLAGEMTAAGFTGVHIQTRRAGRRNLVIICGKPDSPGRS